MVGDSLRGPLVYGFGVLSLGQVLAHGCTCLVSCHAIFFLVHT